MFILENVPLSTYSTMKLGGNAAFFTEVNTRDEVVEAISWADERNLPVIMVGIGSNIVWRDEGYPGLVLVNKIQGLEIAKEFEDHYLTVGSGMNWDEFVAKTVSMGMTGIECLSLIPGTTGATPIQNVGAYGQEVSNSILTVEAYDRQSKQLVNLRASECGFGYRTSRFKTTDRGRFFITAVTFYLKVGNPSRPFYEAVDKYFHEHGIKEITPQVMRDTVIDIRSAKLPDPVQVSNCGSFFANPVMSRAEFDLLLIDHPTIHSWDTDDNQVKIPAAWLIEQAGFKDFHDSETGMAIWPSQALVLVNESAESTAQLLAFKQKIIDAVKNKFNITLEQEPELLP